MLPWPSQKQVFRRKAKLREAMASLFAEARKLGSGDVDAMLQGDPGLRARIRAALREGGSSFQKGYERWAAGDWDLSPSPSRSRSREATNHTKSKPQPSRSRSQRESRSVSSRKSKRKQKKKRRARYSSSHSSSSDRDRKRPRGSTSPSQEGKKQADEKVNLATASVSQLRSLCLKHGVLPTGIIEKSDLVNALTPILGLQETPAQRTPTPTAQPQGRAPRVSKFDMMTAPPPKDTKIMGLTIPVPSKAPSGTGQSFTRAAMQAMSSKELRTLCIERKVLPPGPVERSELLQALAPLASG